MENQMPGNPVETMQYSQEPSIGRGESQLSQGSSFQFTPAEDDRRPPSITATSTARVSTYNFNIIAKASAKGTSRATATSIINTTATATVIGTSRGRGARGRPARGASSIVVSAAGRARIRRNNTRGRPVSEGLDGHQHWDRYI
ncbi:hypothetical protein Droror1_Dr00006223 [Drosera rotundifolia]